MTDPKPPQFDRPCSKCGCPLKFAPNASTRKTVPLDLRSPCYLVFRRADGSEFAWSAREFVEASGEEVMLIAPGGTEPEPLMMTGVFVSHWASCPAANEIKREQKEAQKSEKQGS